MITYFPKNRGRLAFEDGNEKVTVYQHSDLSDYYVYYISNNLPASDLISFINQGVLFEEYPFKIKMNKSDLGLFVPDMLRSEGIDQIGELPTNFEYSNDDNEVLIGAIYKTQGESGRYFNQDEMQWFIEQDFEILGKSDLNYLKNNDSNWIKEEEQFI